MIVERKADAKPHVWTPERVDELARLWAQCHSAAEIARLLGCGLTRCAVLGKVHRLKLASHATPPRLVTRPARLRHAADAPLPDSPHSRDLSFLDLKPRDCRFAVNDDPPFRFCGQPRRTGSPYCAYHHALTHRPLENAAAAKDAAAHDGARPLRVVASNEKGRPQSAPALNAWSAA